MISYTAHLSKHLGHRLLVLLDYGHSAFISQLTSQNEPIFQVSYSEYALTLSKSKCCCYIKLQKHQKQQIWYIQVVFSFSLQGWSPCITLVRIWLKNVREKQEQGETKCIKSHILRIFHTVHLYSVMPGYKWEELCPPSTDPIALRNKPKSSCHIHMSHLHLI